MNWTQGFLPLEEFQRDPAVALRLLQERGGPLVLTIEGQPSLVLHEVAAFQELLEAQRRAGRGPEDAAGPTMQLEDAIEALRRKHGLVR